MMDENEKNDIGNLAVQLLRDDARKSANLYLLSHFVSFLTVEYCRAHKDGVSAILASQVGWAAEMALREAAIRAEVKQEKVEQEKGEK